jgi:hypothetical protein
MVVSRSEAVIISASFLSSKRKSSSIGSVLLVFNTPLKAVRFLDNKELETMNFIL